MWRWSSCGGGPNVEVVLMWRWSSCGGGLYVEVVFVTSCVFNFNNV